MTSPLPVVTSNQTFVSISPIPGGFITLPDNVFVRPFHEGAKRTVPSLAFLITHPGTRSFHSDGQKPFRMMFDLGLRKHKDRYPASLAQHLANRAPIDLEPGVAAQLREGGVDPGEIDLVLLSHVHYDHHGDPEDFPKSQFRVGYGATNVLRHGLDSTAAHQHFVPDTLPVDRSQDLPDPADTSKWSSLGPFPATLDLFGDGSVYVIDAPGHLPGHVNLLCRLEKRWVLLCGDSFHDRRLLSGEKEIGTWEANGTIHCIHFDKQMAAENIRRLQEFDQLTGHDCELIAAHDDEWLEKNKSTIFPSVLS